MSNPTVATKLLTLIKGIFGRKEAMPATGPAKAAGPAAPRSAEPQETPAAATPPASEASESVAVSGETATEPEAAGDAPASEKTSPEPAVPATADLRDQTAQIAEELAVAEARTEVASDEVLERVRKEAAPSADELAVPAYDDLTLPSIRARLRKLTIVQVRDLRAYEVAHQGRPEFIKMYDNRIAKLESAE
ncbi:hypothetical protein BJF83_13060 [Nocardiopsis sp. CNR-923]|uniref:hypothetical protein n=1 Tax=Nocardiopsis sp. CNR-923 TaxID=1904965 RepID=UPI00095BD84C|nr:hypothetical protein [Nocardiopsis sp. CNR-923]OLT29029.1 hypothetical protein BJF83_13060 [Nocardiopsis sp. CNR-923]